MTICFKNQIWFCLIVATYPVRNVWYLSAGTWSIAVQGFFPPDRRLVVFPQLLCAHCSLGVSSMRRNTLVFPSDLNFDPSPLSSEPAATLDRHKNGFSANRAEATVRGARVERGCRNHSPFFDQRGGRRGRSHLRRTRNVRCYVCVCVSRNGMFVSVVGRIILESNSGYVEVVASRLFVLCFFCEIASPPARLDARSIHSVIMLFLLTGFYLLRRRWGFLCAESTLILSQRISFPG